jgi:hypothetical protein
MERAPLSDAAAGGGSVPVIRAVSLRSMASDHDDDEVASPPPPPTRQSGVTASASSPAAARSAAGDSSATTTAPAAAGLSGGSGSNDWRELYAAAMRAANAALNQYSTVGSSGSGSGPSGLHAAVRGNGPSAAAATRVQPAPVAWPAWMEDDDEEEEEEEAEDEERQGGAYSGAVDAAIEPPAFSGVGEAHGNAGGGGGSGEQQEEDDGEADELAHAEQVLEEQDGGSTTDDDQ